MIQRFGSALNLNLHFHMLFLVIFEPLDFIARLAALVPKPRFHLTRFHGVFAPNSKHRAMVTGAAKKKQAQSTAEPSPNGEEHRLKKNWVMRLKRVFNIDITVCRLSITKY